MKNNCKLIANFDTCKILEIRRKFQCRFFIPHSLFSIFHSSFFHSSFFTIPLPFKKLLYICSNSPSGQK